MVYNKFYAEVPQDTKIISGNFTKVKSFENKDDVMSLHFLLQDLRSNITAYIEVLDSVIKLWIEGLTIHVPAEPLLSPT